MDGDVDVSQRKGKVITLFDVKVKLEYSGTSLPRSRRFSWLTGGRQEVAHDTEEDEYVVCSLRSSCHAGARKRTY